MSKADFIARVSRAFGESVPTAPSTVAAETGNQIPAVGVSNGDSSSGRDTPPSGREGPLETAATTTHEQQAARLAEQQQQEAEEAERRRKEKGKGKAKPEPEPKEENAPASKPREQAQEANQQYRQRRLEAEQERQRILRQIEHDRAERKAREEERKEERRAAALAAETGGIELAPAPARNNSIPSAGSQRRHEFCALQVRLFDGSTIRTRLPSSDNVRIDVRRWVDENHDSDGKPYTFRVIFPNRLIDETEEDQSLEALGLTPSSTLVLVPVEKFSSAYNDTNPGVFRRLLAFILHVFNMILAFFSTIFTGAPRQEESAGALGPTPQQRETPGNRDEGRFTGFRNPADSQRDYQLYNGNSVSPVPAKKDSAWAAATDICSLTLNRDQTTMTMATSLAEAKHEREKGGSAETPYLE